MHTTQAGDLCVNHNSDWSGAVYIRWRNRTLEVDGEAFLALCKQVAADETKARIIAFIEDMEP